MPQEKEDNSVSETACKSLAGQTVHGIRQAITTLDSAFVNATVLHFNFIKASPQSGCHHCKGTAIDDANISPIARAAAIYWIAAADARCELQNGSFWPGRLTRLESLIEKSLIPPQPIRRIHPVGPSRTRKITNRRSIAEIKSHPGAIAK